MQEIHRQDQFKLQIATGVKSKGIMRIRREALAILIVLVFAASCGSDEDNCVFPGVIEGYCGGRVGLDNCSCINGPIRFEAYVSLPNLPAKWLVSTPDDYLNGNDFITFNCVEGNISIPDSLYNPDPFERFDDPPIYAKFANAYLVKEMLPGNGVSFASWHLEIQTPDQVEYFQVLGDSLVVLGFP